MSKALNVNPESFESDLAKAVGPVVLDFYAAWCAPCRQVTPVIEALADEYDGKATVIKVNVDPCLEIASKYNVGSLPCVLILVDGEVKERFSGVVGKQKLKDSLDKHLS